MAPPPLLLAPARLRGGTNYLSQSVRAQSSTIALASPTGVSVLRLAPSGLPHQQITHVEAHSADDPLTALALCPGAPELLATAHLTEQFVRVWTLSFSAAPSTFLRLDVSKAVCRQLVWHPTRRVLAAVTPARVMLLDCSKLVASPDAPPPLPVPLPGAQGRSLRTACWSGDCAGGTLAAASEEEVFVFRWPAPGTWSRFATLRIPLAGRRACAIAASADVLLLSLAPPIVIGTSSASAPPLPLVTPRAAELLPLAPPPEEAAASAAPPLDLRGRLGAAAAPATDGVVARLVAEVAAGGSSAAAAAAACEAAAAPPAGGELIACTVESLARAKAGGEAPDILSVGSAAAVALPRPDMLGASRLWLDEMALDDRRRWAKGLVAVGCSLSGHLCLFSIGHQPEAAGGRVVLLSCVRRLELSDGMKTVGLTFDSSARLLVLGGKRKHAPVLFSSLAAEQELSLSVFDKPDPAVETLPTAEGHSSPDAPPPPTPTAATSCEGGGSEEPALSPSLQAAPNEAQRRSCDERTGDRDALQVSRQLVMLQAHLDERFDRIEQLITSMDVRLAKLERQATA
ncbi:hypothetical protein AB1Y20_015330 [Prymnesium parvum]|uniref:WD repeat and coiled-coil-containing protein n=1 Tax=Prymnesium parvum TaxID=97485 RepID=A0AB34JXE5_PRYPA